MLKIETVEDYICTNCEFMKLESFGVLSDGSYISRCVNYEKCKRAVKLYSTTQRVKEFNNESFDPDKLLTQSECTSCVYKPTCDKLPNGQKLCKEHSRKEQ